MHPLDYVVLVGYFALMIGIGVVTSRRIKKQEDYFLGGRSFGKLLQTFAAFGAGTGSSDPVNTARTTFTSGMSGMWSVMYWLFVTPFYWITGVWYRRMRHLTLGDWFVERYESRAMGVAYALYGLLFFMVYGSMLFSAIGKFAAPLTQIETVTILGHTLAIEYALVPLVGLVVLVYGIAGGLEAAYYTDLIQGLCIILLSVILVPYGLAALVERFAPDGGHSVWYGFTIIHQQIPPQHFQVIGTGASEFPLHRIIAIVLLNLVGVVVQPHFIATGGGSAKTELNARLGLVTGNFLKRFCTIGWVLTALIALALFADHPELVSDPDKTWGVASRELLGPGLTGLMLACLLAALMSSVDAYMVVGSGLVVRNIYAPYFKGQASEREYVLVARITGVVVVAGSVIVSLSMMDVFQQLELTWVIPVLFAAPFWVGMYWRRASRAAVWTSVVFCALFFFLVPYFAPRVFPALRTSPALLVTNQFVQRTETRQAAPTDVAARRRAIALWDERAKSTAREALGPRPQALTIGEQYTKTTTVGGVSPFWSQGVHPIATDGQPPQRQPAGPPRQVNEHLLEQTFEYDTTVSLSGQGNLRLDFLLFQWLGLDLRNVSTAWLTTLELPAKIVTPFLIMLVVSLFTQPSSQPTLDRYYAKMKTPVHPDPETDQRQLAAAYANPEQTEARKLFPGSNWEFQRPHWFDIAGFIVSVLICFAIVGLAVALVNVGRPDVGP